MLSSLSGGLRGVALPWGDPVVGSGVVGVGHAAVVRTVDRAVDCVAVLSRGAVGCVVARVTVGPVAVDVGVAVGAGPDVARVVMAEVVRGDAAGNRAQHIPPDHLPSPFPAPPVPQEPGQQGTLSYPPEKGVCLPLADTHVLPQLTLTRGLSAFPAATGSLGRWLALHLPASRTHGMSPHGPWVGRGCCVGSWGAGLRSLHPQVPYASQ